jgi:hypothetical protein
MNYDEMGPEWRLHAEWLALLHGNWRELEMSYDSKSEELAEHFLDPKEFAHTQAHVRNLAQTIQTAIEDYLEHTFNLTGSDGRRYDGAAALLEK